MGKLSRVSDEKEKRCAYVSLMLGYVLDMLMGLVIITCLKDDVILLIPNVSIGLQYIAYLVIVIALGFLLAHVADLKSFFLTVCTSIIYFIVAIVILNLSFSCLLQSYSSKDITIFIALILSYVTFEAVMFTAYFFFDMGNRIKELVLAVVFMMMSVAFYQIILKAGAYYCLVLVILELLSLIYLEWCFDLIKNNVCDYFEYVGTGDLSAQICTVCLQAMHNANFMLFFLPGMWLKFFRRSFK
ncbi:MAG: hypothetical protein IAA89_02275 [Firmicutes bacterium]|uniref:Uncharacterized protein n=1 Tax=Candidatus Gallilactobacillus intestinavium TaxID=2840838 RepID=A0A9D9H4Z1_9LACO|nr:hypothetical protein [Candidatus Gallilactobacillus intestinavium]